MGHWLEVTRGPAAGERLDVEEELAVGRVQAGPANLGGDSELSREHARFWRKPEGDLVVEDLGSTNGTLVNGRRIDRPVVLNPGDKIQVGISTLEVRPQASEIPTGGQRTHIRSREQAWAGGAAASARVPAEAAGAAGGAPAAPAVGRAVPSVPRLPGRDGAEAKGRARPGPPGPPGRPGRRDPRVGLLGLLLVLAIAGLVVALIAKGSSNTASGDGPFVGTAYVLSNRHTPGGNSVLALRYGTASLAPLRLREYPTGGSGSYALGSTMALDGDQQVWTNPAHTLMFAVNQGSDTIAVFHIASDGTLTPVKGSPFPSGGTGPVSVGLSGNTLVVVNKAEDNVRKLTGPASVTTFKVNSDGSLQRFGPAYTEPASSNPTQALVSPDGRLVIVPELGAPNILTFTRSSSGSLTPGPVARITQAESKYGTLLGPPPGTKGKPPAGHGAGPPQPAALGMVFDPGKRYLFTSLPVSSELVVYKYDPSGKLTFVKGLAIPKGFQACWDAVTPDGRWLYIALTANNSIAVYNVSDPANPQFVQVFKLGGTGGAFNLQVGGSTSRLLFALSARDASSIPAGDGNQLHVLRIGADGRLTESAGSPVQLPVDANTTSFGLALVPH